MLFIFVAWLLVLLTFTIWIRALHSIPIYIHTPLQLQEQTLQIENVMSITQILLATAIACIGLHVMLPGDAANWQFPHVHRNTLMNASAMSYAQNATS